MTAKIKCAQCRFACSDKKASDKNWTAFECGNNKSKYHKALLNVTTNGEKQSNTSWGGCEVGRMKI